TGHVPHRRHGQGIRPYRQGDREAAGGAESQRTQPQGRADPQGGQLAAGSATKRTDSTRQVLVPELGQALSRSCDPETTVVQSRVIVNGFLIGTSLACQLAPGGLGLALWR